MFYLAFILLELFSKAALLKKKKKKPTLLQASKHILYFLLWKNLNIRKNRTVQ